MSERSGENSVVWRFLFGAREGVHIALESMRANPFRSGLTVVGVGIGVSVVVLIAALITGIRGSVAEGIEEAGPRTMFVSRIDLSDIQIVNDGSPPSWLSRPPVRATEAMRVAELPGVQAAVMSYGLQDPGQEGGITLQFGGTRITGVTGVAESERWSDYRSVEWVSGRNFLSVEVEEARTVIIITQRLAEDLVGRQDPIGQRVRVSAGGATPLPFTVIGVVDPGDNLFAEQLAHIAIIPYSTGLRRFKISEDMGQMVVVPRDEWDQFAVEDAVIGLLRTMRGLAPGEENDFSILRSTQLMELFDRFTGVFFIIMLALSSVGLLVGGVGVIGIMLISVTERTREIGIRKALGASRGEILWQFLVEAGVLTLLGGAAGLALGAAGAWAVAAATPVPASIPLWAVIVSLLMAAVTGMLFGLAPAARAARLDPVVALRYE